MIRKKDTEMVLVRPATLVVDKFSEGLRIYLDGLGLPVDGVLVAADERGRVLQNAPQLVDLLDKDQRTNALYVSKFIAACGAGLFDAALNFIWDEVVVRLRDRVNRFDLSYFYDTAVPQQERQDFQTQEDLRSLSDAALIKGALKCGMLTDVGYKHLDYIRDMRNWASAAHPNQASLTGFQVVAWFETCLKEVILREPEGQVLEVGRLLRNLREQTLGAHDVPAIAASVCLLPSDLASALLRAAAGIYCDPRQDVRVRENIKFIAIHLWNAAPESTRGEIGLKHANFAANGDVDRSQLAHQFLDLVNGLPYLPATELALEIQDAVARLESAHDGWSNFSNEPPLARRLRKFIPNSGKIPSQVNDEYVRVLLRCAIGRTSGVSHMAEPIYDELIALFEEPQIRAVIAAMGATEIATRLSNAGCSERLLAIIAKLRVKTVAQAIQQILSAISQATPAQLPILHKDSRFQRLVEKM
jgi:hypothetical protein